MAAVSFLHHSMGYKSPASSNPTLRLAIRCVQRLQEPIHLKPTRLPLTVEMLGHMLQRLEAAPLKRHDCRMLRAALTLGFFGFLRVSEFILKNRRFDPRYHPTRQDISWTGEGMHFFIKRSKTDQMGKGTTICIGRTEGRHMCPVAAMEACRGCCRCPIQSSPPLPLQRWEAAYIQELPLHLPIPGGAMWLQSSPIQHTQSTYWCSHSSHQSRPSH